MERLNEILRSGVLPESTIQMINKLDRDGKQLLNDYEDINSELFKYIHPVNITERFLADSKIADKLYHYTSYEAFKKIIDSQKFLIGSAYHMNDLSELKYIYDLLKEESINLNAPSEFISYIEHMKNNINPDVYIWSFTKNASSQALQAYGDVAIEFNNQDIQEELATYCANGAKTLDEYTDGSAYVFPLTVVYEEKVHKEYISTIAKAWITAFKNYDIDPTDMKQISGDILQAFIFFSMIFKNPILYQEEEIRFIIFNINKDDSINPDDYMGDKPVKTFRFSLDIIQKIILSHKLKDEIESTENYLRERNYTNTHVELTKLLY